MSPLSVRRFRADRLLQGEFEALRGRVLATVRRRLAASGVAIDPSDLDGCYSQAWQGLYMAVLDGGEIENPTGWLVLATFRRAIDEHRSQCRRPEPVRREGLAGEDDGPGEPGQELDLAAELDDRIRLRQLFEGLRSRLSAREREAAVLCYLQGLSRAEAAARMGVSEARMGKLMEGPGAGRPGVAAKVGSLVATIRDGHWCEEQGSLMRGFAFGILDPDGERRRLALQHSSECPACRAYVASLRGLAAALPPAFLPFGVGAGVLARAGEGAHALAAGSATAAGAVPPAAGGGVSSAAAGAGTAAPAAGVGRGIGAAIGAPAAGAGGAAGGGWLIAGGPLGAKLAVGCLLALGVGASCVELGVGVGLHARAPHSQRARIAARAARQGDLSAAALRSPPPLPTLPAPGAGVAGSRPQSASAPLAPAARASREFGPEQLARSSGQSATRAGGAAGARLARVSASGSNAGGIAPATSAPAGAPGSTPPSSTVASAAAGKAAREFSPG